MIQEGLLWYDDDPGRSIADKVSRAVQRYQQKHGHAPDVCYVHPGQVREEGLRVGVVNIGLVKVLPAKTVLPHHFWLGVLDKRPKVVKVQNIADSVAQVTA